MLNLRAHKRCTYRQSQNHCSSSGEVKYKLIVPVGTTLDSVETVHGRVTIILPENADVEVSADTLNGGSNGRDFGLEAEKGFFVFKIAILVGKRLYFYLIYQKYITTYYEKTNEHNEVAGCFSSLDDKI
jgi:hypothetical protein